MNTLVDQYTDRYFDPRRGQVIGVNYSPNGQAIEYELGLGNGKRMAGDALGIGIDGLSDLLYREKPRQLTPGELNDFLGGMDPGDLFGGDVADGNVYLRQLLKFGEGGEPGRLYREQQEKLEDMNRATEYIAGFDMPADLSYPHIPGRRLEGVPNANDPVMREKLRNRRLRNPAGGEDIPGFLGKA